jgi:hypothetical protein
MTGSKRPSTSSLRRFITSRPYVPIAELRRRFGLDEPDAVTRIQRDRQVAYVGLPEREATKIGDLWARDEIGVELSVEVHAPVVVGIYPMRIARFVTDGGFAPLNANGYAPGDGHQSIGDGAATPADTNGQRSPDRHASHPAGPPLGSPRIDPRVQPSSPRD